VLQFLVCQKRRLVRAVGIGVAGTWDSRQYADDIKSSEMLNRNPLQHSHLGYSEQTLCTPHTNLCYIFIFCGVHPVVLLTYTI
jgi:hypothetical protein